jgi:hypothetical protein
MTIHGGGASLKVLIVLDIKKLNPQRGHKAVWPHPCAQTPEAFRDFLHENIFDGEPDAVWIAEAIHVAVNLKLGGI